MKDYHVHPSYSIDAEGSIDEYCRMALQREIDEICFTTHLDADPQRDDCFVVLGGKRVSVQSSGWLEDYENTIRQAGDAYQQSGLEVKLGVEVDLYQGVVEDLPESFHKTDFDMIVGSVHLVDHLAVSLPEEANRIFQRYDSQQLGTVYYGLLFDMIDTGFFDILGHLDIYRRFGESHYGQEIHHLWKTHIEELAGKMSQFGVGFEINTSAWRKGQKEAMPTRPIIEALLERGVTTVTVGSDAHAPKDVGFGVSRAYSLLRACGKETVSAFSNRRESIIRI